MDEKDDDRTVARIFHDVGLLKNDLIPILLMTLGTSVKGDRIALACGSSSPPLSFRAQLTDWRMSTDSGTDRSHDLAHQRRRGTARRPTPRRTPQEHRLHLAHLGPTLVQGGDTPHRGVEGHVPAHESRFDKDEAVSSLDVCVSGRHP